MLSGIYVNMYVDGTNHRIPRPGDRLGVEATCRAAGTEPSGANPRCIGELHSSRGPAHTQGHWQIPERRTRCRATRQRHPGRRRQAGPMALIADSGGIYGLYDASERKHKAIRAAFETERGVVIIPMPVLSEIDYLLRKKLGIQAELDFIDDVRAGAFTLEPCSLDDLH